MSGAWVSLASTFPLLLALVLLLGLAAWPRSSALLAAAPWVAAAAVTLQATPHTTLELEHVLLGSRWLLDEPARWASGLAAALFLTLGLANRHWLAASPGAAACLLLAWAGLLVQCLAGDLLLHLAGASVAGYAMLALTLAAGSGMEPARVAAIAAVLLAGDLALLELATLLAKAGSGLLFHEEIEAALAGRRGAPLVELCLVLGFASRVAIAALILGWSPAPRLSALRVLPGWLAVGLCSAFGRARIPGSPPVRDGGWEPWSVELGLGIPMLALVLGLPWALRSAAAAGARVGRLAAGVRDGMRDALLRARRPGLAAREALRTAEAGLGGWSVATSLLVLVAAGLLLRALA